MQALPAARRAGLNRLAGAFRSRAVSVAHRIAGIEESLAAACRRAGREPSSVRLIGASKMQPPASLQEAYDAGLRRFGENRVQEGVAKASALPPGVEWHLLGPLQSNKVRPAVRLFDLFHAIDRPAIAVELDREATLQGRRIGGLIEVNVGGEPSKHGFAPQGIAEAVAPLATLERCAIRGLMAIPPPAATAEGARPWFRSLRELARELNARLEWGGRLVELSMGMSDDFEVAIEEGATYIRVGSALFGPRPT